jgi:flagellin-like hook-associated protein FlgL
VRISSSGSGFQIAARFNAVRAFGQVAKSSDRLSTMQRLNSASDGPAALIAATELQAQLTSIEKGIAAAERTPGMLSVADSGLAQASRLLDRIQGNLVASTGNTASPQEKAAMQSEIDAALEALDRLGNTSYSGRRVFTGDSVEFLLGSEPGQTASVNLGEVTSADLGNASGTLSELGSGGEASLESGNGELAEEIIEAARQEVLAARVEIGTFEKYSVDSTVAVLEGMAVNISSAYSQIADTEVASEMSILARAQILSKTSIQALQFTNFTNQSAAGLLENLVQRLLM